MNHDPEYEREEMSWSNRQEAGEFDDQTYELGPDGQYHSRADMEDAELDRREAQAA